MARAEAKYRITADDQTRRGLRSAQGRLQRFSRFMRSGVAVAATAIGAAFVGVGNAIANAARQTRDLNEQAKALSISANELAQLDFGARAAGLSVDQVTDLVTRIDELILSVERGEETGVDFFDNLGVDASRLKSIDDATDRVAALLGAFRELRDPSRRRALLDELGTGAAQLAALGPEAFREAAARAEQFDIAGDVDRVGEQARNALTAWSELFVTLTDRARAFLAFIGRNTILGDRSRALAERLTTAVGTPVGAAAPPRGEQSGSFVLQRDISLAAGATNKAARNLEISSVELRETARQLRQTLNTYG